MDVAELVGGRKKKKKKVQLEKFIRKRKRYLKKL